MVWYFEECQWLNIRSDTLLCFSCFRYMFQVFWYGCCKSRVAYVALHTTLQVSVPNISSVFSDICCKCVYLGIAYVSHICCKAVSTQPDDGITRRHDGHQASRVHAGHCTKLCTRHVHVHTLKQHSNHRTLTAARSWPVALHPSRRRNACVGAKCVLSARLWPCRPLRSSGLPTVSGVWAVCRPLPVTPYVPL
jgi:hypothetical protein